jgi:hypothetical protein
MNSTIARRTNPTILRVEDLCFPEDEDLLSRAVDPPDELEDVFDDEGVPEGAEGDDGVSVGVGPVGVKEGDAEGATLVLNGFPSFLYKKELFISMKYRKYPLTRYKHIV